MNVVFEDVCIFDELIDVYDGNWEVIFFVFLDLCLKDINVIVDLVVDNFYEMQDKVDDFDFIQKCKLEMKLE